ncbi:PadR family transcriptional regulator [Micromonospora endophytica]|uniref:PadR family transcriptional regulator n=1 Tax=Micromonospora endophytica TaxID=515350 RepID=A0A2W2CEV0_9ACTN|nr:PadR family transcriptional regulator [Micromonospora endophytica]PZF97925.1 PadR family transcriptional regulator [Micromonospora endophytica]RIW40670.1 PadR family transcriptional regulator [Micromonospora endophytica]BCJ61355.1 PadR family transcriptional regulator [Micromonospora endophytica]
MAKRRKVGNLMALAVLSVLAQRPMHPYEIATALRGWGKDQDMPIKWGSLYTVVGNLDRHGFIAAAESVRAGRRPERTVYRITDAGRAELVDWARELLATPMTEYPRFRAGLSVLAALHPDEAAELLRQRLHQLVDNLATARAALAGHATEVPRLFLVESEYDLVLGEAEASWIRALLAEFDAGTFPGLDQWRTFHETGELPAEVAALAERTSTPERSDSPDDTSS